MKKQREAARTAWENAVAAAKTKAAELEAKGDAVTAEDKAALDGLISAAKTAKADFERLDALCLVEDELAEAAHSEEQGTGRKTRNNGAPAVLPDGSRGTSKPLKVSNIWRATWAAGAGQNPAVIRKYAGEEYDLSERLKAAGYVAESLGGVLFPLADELLVEPVDDHGQKLADFTDLRKEIRERMEIKVDAGELGWLLKRFPDWAKAAFGLERKDLMLGDDTLGGFLIPATQSTRIIDLLRARAVVVRAGATEIGLPPSGNLSYPRLTSDPEFTYGDPDASADINTSNVGTGVLRLMAKSLRGAVSIPNDLMRYSSPSVEMLIRNALAARGALAEDRAFLESPGSSLAPKGIINYGLSTAETPTAGKVTLHVASTTGADGDTLEPEDIAIIQALYEEGLDPDPATAWIMRPLFWSSVRNKRADAVTAGDKKGPFMFDVNRSVADGPVNRLGDVPVLSTTQASRNRAKGSASNLFYTLYGNFRRAIIGRVGVIELAVSEHVKFLQDKTVIRAILRNDLALEHEESFVFTDDLLLA